MKENTFIRVYNNAIDLDYCDTLIEKFESHSEQYEKIDIKYVKEVMCFHELHLWKYMDTWKEDIDKLATIFTQYVEEYKSEFSARMFPKKYGFEPFKMKRYLPDSEDCFPPHVDVTGKNNNARFLAFFVYLSDNDEGKTKFDYQDVITDCAKGNMIIFPPLWPWVHSGEKPVQVSKYIIGGYLHYIE